MGDGAMTGHGLAGGQVLLDLYDMATDDGGAGGEPGLAQQALDYLELNTGFEFLAVLLQPATGGPLEPVALSRQGQDEAFLDADIDYVRGRCRGNSVGITHWVARNARSARIGDVTRDPRYLDMRPGIRSELCVPLRLGSETLGVLNTETCSANAYTPQDERFLTIAAGHISLAVRRVRQRWAACPSGSVDTHYLPVCMYCEAVQERGGEWVQSDLHLLRRYGLRPVDTICPACNPRGARSPDAPGGDS